MADAPRRRLSREARRAQLVAIGRRLVESSSFDALSTDDVAAEAGISRSLLFHYFPNRERFLLAIAEHASRELLELTDPDPGLPPLERLRAGLAAYVDYVAEQRSTYLALIRGQAGGDAEMQALFEQTRQRLAERILDGLGVDPAAADEALRLAARGYLALVEEVTVTWLREEVGAAAEVDRAQLLDLLEAAGAGVMGAAGLPVESLR